MIKLLKPSYILLILIVISSFAYADKISCVKNQVFNGLIVKSTETEVWIKEKKTTNKIPKRHILSIEFSRADLIVLNGNDFIKCKILYKAENKLYYINESGLNSLYEADINSKNYNSSDTLIVDTLPVTDEFFVNKPPNIYYSYKFKKNYYLSISPGYHSCTSSYRSPDKTQRVNSVEGFKIAGEGGYTISEYINGGLGLELFLPSSYSYKDNYNSSLSYAFYYLSSDFKYRELNISIVSFHAGIDIGFLSATEEIKTPDHQSAKASDLNLATKIKLGASAQFNNMEFTLDFAYLTAREFQFDNANPGFDNYPFIIDGMSLSLGINFLFYINKD